MTARPAGALRCGRLRDSIGDLAGDREDRSCFGQPEHSFRHDEAVVEVELTDRLYVRLVGDVDGEAQRDRTGRRQDRLEFQGPLGTWLEEESLVVRRTAGVPRSVTSPG